MALAGGRLFVPWVDLATRDERNLVERHRSDAEGRGGLTALAVATGRVLWQQRLPALAFGAATVANDVVFTSTYDGGIYAFASATGKLLWRARARAGINSFPAIAGQAAPGRRGRARRRRTPARRAHRLLAAVAGAHRQPRRMTRMLLS